MPAYLFYTMVQKVKNDQKLKSRGGGPAFSLKTILTNSHQCMRNQFLVAKKVFLLKLIEEGKRGESSV